MTKIPVTLTTYATITVDNQDVLDLSRGEAWTGTPFGSEDDLLEHLTVNLAGQGHRLSQLDGWADCSDDDVTVHVDEIEADLHRAMTS